MKYKVGVVVFTVARPCGWKKVVIVFCVSFVERLFVKRFIVKQFICQAIYLLINLFVHVSKGTTNVPGMLWV